MLFIINTLENNRWKMQMHTCVRKTSKAGPLKKFENLITNVLTKIENDNTFQPLWSLRR